MVSERIQGRIDRLLNQADEAADARRWNEVLEPVRAILALDKQNEDALALRKMAEAAADGSPTATAADLLNRVDDRPNASPPVSFVAGRYRVERFLSEGGRKRVFLAHDTTLDRDIAFAQIRTPKGSTTWPASGSCVRC